MRIARIGFGFGLVLAGLAGAGLAAPMGGTGADAQAPLTPQLLSVTETMDRLGLVQGQALVLKAACCKRCKKGKACGDSCISKSKTCHVGPGCACD